MLLSPPERTILRAMVEGEALRHHSDLEGGKRYALHPADGAERPARAWAVSLLETRGLVVSNQKFPTSTYLLTERGQAVAGRLSDRPLRPLVSRRPE